MGVVAVEVEVGVVEGGGGVVEVVEGLDRFRRVAVVVVVEVVEEVIGEEGVMEVRSGSKELVEGFKS